jgi:hypothetical protein
MPRAELMLKRPFLTTPDLPGRQSMLGEQSGVAAGPTYGFKLPHLRYALL